MRLGQHTEFDELPRTKLLCRRLVTELQSLCHKLFLPCYLRSVHANIARTHNRGTVGFV